MMEKIRVLHVVTYMGRGGLETMLMNYFRNIDRSKVQFDFLVHRDFEADYDKEILSLGGRIYHLPQLNPFSRKYHKAMDSFFAEHPYQIVHSHLDCMSAYPLSHAKKAGVPVRIAHAHNKSQDKNIKYPLKILSKSLIPKYATHLFACGAEAGLWMFNGRKFQILYNAIDSSIYIYSEQIRREVREELQLGNKLVIGHVGRFSPQKNHEFIVSLFYELQKRKSDSVLILMGGGKDRQQIEKIVQELDIGSKVVFTGIRSDVNRLMQAMDVFLFPSLYEGLPVAMIEAQAAGLPCVISENIPEETIITDLVSRRALEAPVSEWIDKILKAGQKERRDQTVQIRKAGYDIKENAERLQDFYMKVGVR